MFANQRSLAAFASLALLLTASTADAGLVVGYRVTGGTELAPNASGSGVTGSALVRSPDLVPLNIGGSSFSSDRWSSNSFLQLGFSSTQAWDLSEVMLEVTLGVTATTPETFKLQASTGGGAFSDIVGSPTLNAVNQNFVLRFDVSSLTNITNIELRLIATDAAASGSTGDIVALLDTPDSTFGFGSSDVIVSGNASAVPEPSSSLIALLGASLCFVSRRHRTS